MRFCITLALLQLSCKENLRIVVHYACIDSLERAATFSASFKLIALQSINMQVCTIGPASEDAETLQKVVETGITFYLVFVF
jgi:intracellular sulfur oxidation DsrE/DsrF family protein